MGDNEGRNHDIRITRPDAPLREIVANARETPVKSRA